MGKTIYSNKRIATRKKIDGVFIESFRSSGGAELTVKEICEKAGINRSTFYAYYRDTDDMREQIEGRLIDRFEKRLAPVINLHLDDPNKVVTEVLEFNRENGYLPLLLISSGSFSFQNKISKTVSEILAGTHLLKDCDPEKVTMLFTYHFAGMSMLLQQMMGNNDLTDESYEDMARRISELLKPVVKNGLLPAIRL